MPFSCRHGILHIKRMNDGLCRRIAQDCLVPDADDGSARDSKEETIGSAYPHRRTRCFMLY